ncbi:TonB-dependent receptor [Romeria aff. gracilis LEGE 07310]|uniref:TonB-dependent receptor n=1 Tax=Vasconcelosia minhoensis LEGE 07310 TaxID=915328 RepID=A0A8J7DDG3_9CYAN|nr:TonB-dependent receptor [Romeria aff. gracilis LEGE 07310]
MKTGSFGLTMVGLLTAILSPAVWANPPAPVMAAEPATSKLLQPSPMTDASEPEPAAPTLHDWLAQAVAAEPAVITDVQVNSTPAGLNIVLMSDQPLSAGESRVVGNALITEIPNATLNLTDGAAAEQFSPAEGIALVQVSSLPDGGVQVAVTGTDAPPQAQISSEAGNLVLDITPGAATAESTEEGTIQLVVTATRTEEDIRDVPRSVTVITREEIEEQSQLTTNLQDILGQTVPGLGPPTQSFRNFPQTLRGRDVQILVDGVPISTNQSTAFVFELRSIAPSAIEQIEVVRGPSAVFGEGATGGIINIITRQPTEELTQTLETRGNTRGDFASDSFGTYLEYGASDTSEPFDAVFNASFESFGFAFDGAGDRIPFLGRAPENGRTFNILGKLGIDLGEEQRLQLSVNHFDDSNSVEFINDPTVDDDPDADKARALRRDIEFIGLDDEGIRRFTNVSLNYSHENILGSRLDAQGFYRNNFGRFAEPFEDTVTGFFVTADQESERWGGRVEVETPFSEAFNLLWGADYSQENLSQPYQRIDADEFIESDFMVARFVEDIFLTPPYEVENLGLFAQAQWDISPNWLLSGGARYENIGVSVDDYTAVLFQETPIDVEGGSISADDVVFNIGTVYDLTDEVSVFASFAQGFGVPDFGRLFRSPPEGFTSVEDDLDFTAPQKVDNYELGFRGQWDNVQFSLAGFYNYSDLGVTLVQLTDPLRVEVARAPERVYGVEATVDWQPSETWLLGSTVSWNEGENDLDEDGDFEALDTSRIQPIKLTAYVENETLPGWRNRLQALFVGGRDRGFEAGADFVEIESYFVLNYISSIQAGPGTIQIGIQNLLDEEYFTVGNQQFAPFSLMEKVAAPGRTISIGYQVDF